MWNKQATIPKCPRGDCKHYPKSGEDFPCRGCTCNRESNSICKTFRYEMKDKEGK